jgi:DMSO/TMAO reductase YedYZ molybdopterin-dependent catalytic subunit
VVHQLEPCNCETSVGALVGGVVVPNERFYIRNHFPTPELDPASWRLAVGGLVERPLSLDLRELRSMPSETLVATLECAGNGRSQFTPAIAGEPWGLGAVSTAEWTGVRLGDVLDLARPRPGAIEVVLRGADHGPVEERDDPVAFERSMSLDEARRPEVLLAYAMNGDLLPLEHGRPVRLVVPGRYAVASVKWLTDVELVDQAFAGYFQVDRYVYEWERDGARELEPVGRQRVRALITEPVADAAVEPGNLMVRGVAWSGDGPIATVEVQVGGEPWVPARMVGEPSPHAWQWWERLVRVAQPGPVALRARATDRAGESQPAAAAWNRLGYGNNSIQEVVVRVE